jgi:hypothetical protein
MHVTSYQMHNVLECYSKKLSRTPRNEKSATYPPKKEVGDLSLPPETSRMATMDKISQQVFDKVTDVVALSNSPDPLRNETQGNMGDGASAGDPATEEFTYHVIESINRKRTARLALGGSAALARRLDQMAEKPSVNTTDSWV